MTEEKEKKVISSCLFHNKHQTSGDEIFLNVFPKPGNYIGGNQESWYLTICQAVLCVQSIFREGCVYELQMSLSKTDRACVTCWKVHVDRVQRASEGHHLDCCLDTLETSTKLQNTTFYFLKKRFSGLLIVNCFTENNHFSEKFFTSITQQPLKYYVTIKMNHRCKKHNTTAETLSMILLLTSNFLISDF